MVRLTSEMACSKGSIWAGVEDEDDCDNGDWRVN